MLTSSMITPLCPRQDSQPMSSYNFCCMQLMGLLKMAKYDAHCTHRAKLRGLKGVHSTYILYKVHFFKRKKKQKNDRCTKFSENLPTMRIQILRKHWARSATQNFFSVMTSQPT